ncbi:MAG: lectin-like protein, partial [Planctomycetota bacterium]
MHFLTLSILLLVTAPAAAAQTTFLAENFNSGAVPPPGWTTVNNNGNTASAGWISSGNRAWHEDEGGGVGQTDNTLVSPIIDLSSATAAFLHFDGETNWATYLANHPTSNGNGISNMEISTNGGLTWTVLWTDTSLNSGDTYSPTLNLSAYLGSSNVQIGLHFSGDFAQEWWVDNVIVDDQPVPVLASITNPNNGHPYFLLGQSDFSTANAMAIALGGNLVSIDSGAENSWLLSNFGNFGGTQRNLLLGLNDTALEGTFVWSSGEALTYTNWAAGEPNNGGGGNEDFVQIVSGGQWNDFDGSGGYGVVEISQPTIRSTPMVAGELATITVSGMRVDSFVQLVFSTNGNGPYNGRYGVMEVDPDIITPPFPAIAGGFNFSTY